jgi:hypothetical protein
MGAYLQITSVTGPAQASSGSSVTLNVYVKNVWTSDIAYVDVTAASDGIKFASLPIQRVNAGQTGVWTFTFTMPSSSVTFAIGAYYWGTDNAWHSDDTKYIIVKLSGEAPPPNYAGRIENIKVNGVGIPTTLDYGKNFRVEFDGYNDSTTNVQLWASMRIYRPDGSQAYYGQDAESYPYTNPGGHHSFEFPMEVPYQSPCSVDSYGDWKADIELRVGSSSGTFLARKTGIKIFSTSTTEPPPGGEPTLTGEISGQQIWYSGVDGLHNWLGITTPPVTIKQGDGFNVAFTAKNDSTIGLVLKGTFEVKWPSGKTQTGSDFTGTSIPAYETTVSPGDTHTFKWNPFTQGCAFTADEVGDYSATFNLYGKKPGEADSEYKKLCDAWTGKILTATAAAGGGGAPPTGPISGTPTGEAQIVHLALDYKLIGSGDPIPVTTPITVPDHARLSIIAKNVGSTGMKLRALVWIYSPGPLDANGNPTRGSVAYLYDDTSTLSYNPGSQHEFIFPSPTSTFLIDTEGEWDIVVNITDEAASKLLAKYDGVLCNGQQAAPSIWSTMIDMLPLMMIMMMFSMIIPMTKELGKGEG